jgi:hypothetical protein
MLFVMSLFPSTTVPHDRISQANWAPANDSFSVSVRPTQVIRGLPGAKELLISCSPSRRSEFVQLLDADITQAG